MNILKIALTVAGILLFLVGLLWASQGAGIFPYPATSSMINQSPWILKGATLAIVGIAMVWISRRISR